MTNIYQGNGNPNPIIDGEIGSLYIQLDSTGGGTIWVKESVIGITTGWVTVGNKYGETAKRPTGVQIGCSYFDTDLSHVVWFNGSNWVDATGGIV